MVAVAGHAYLGADVLEVSLGEAARVAAELHLRVLVAMVLTIALPNPTQAQPQHCYCDPSYHRYYKDELL